MKVLKLNYIFVPSNSFGEQYDKSDLSKWNGLMGLLHDNLIDISAVALRITPERQKYATFSFPIWRFQEALTMARPRDERVYSFMLKPFSQKLWVIIFYLLFVSLCIDFATFTLNRNGNLIENVAEYVFLFGQGSVENSNIANIILITGWALAGVILLIFYDAQLSSELAVAAPFEPIITSRDQLPGNEFYYFLR
jgi:hypothetical protein